MLFELALTLNAGDVKTNSQKEKAGAHLIAPALAFDFKE